MVLVDVGRLHGTDFSSEGCQGDVCPRKGAEQCVVPDTFCALSSHNMPGNVLRHGWYMPAVERGKSLVCSCLLLPELFGDPRV